MSSSIQRLRRREEVDHVYGEVAKSAALVRSGVSLALYSFKYLFLIDI